MSGLSIFGWEREDGCTRRSRRRPGLAAVLRLAALLAAVQARPARAAPYSDAFEYHSALPLTEPMPQTTAWARPYVRGPLRVLFFTGQNPNVNVLPNRFVVELMQRFDIDGRAVLVQTGKGDAYAVNYAGGAGIVGEEAGLARLERLMREDYACYVFSGSELLGLIPATTRQQVLDRVRAGAGLLILDTAEEQSLTDVTIAAEAPSFLAGTGLQTGMLGQGRVVRGRPPLAPAENLRQTGSAAVKFGWPVVADTHYEKIGRGLFWAAGNEPALALQLAPAPALAAGVREQVTLRWRNPRPGDRFDLTATVRSLVRGPIPVTVAGELTGAAGECTLTLPALPAGRYFLELRARGDNAIRAWTTAELTVDTEAGVAAPTLDRTWGEAGAAITGQVAVEAGDLPETLLRVQILDRYGRALGRRDIVRPTASTAFSLPTAAWMPALVWVEAVLMSAGNEIGQQMTVYTIPRRQHEDWNLTTWGVLYCDPLHLPLAEAVLAGAGVSGRVETSRVPWWFMTAAGMSYLDDCRSGLQRQHWSGDRSGPGRGRTTTGIHVPEDRCWNDEPAVTERLRQWIHEGRDSWGNRSDFRQHGVHAYNMGDENEALGSCLNEPCLAAYREYLRAQYGGVAALNASWGTDFADFADITPRSDETALPWLPEPARTPWLHRYANLEASALGPTSGSTAWDESWKSYPRWFDRRAFQAANFARYVRKFGDVAREHDPRARAGAEGSLWLDDDIDRVVRSSDWWILYSIPAGEVLRSLAPREYRYGFWIGYTDSGPDYVLNQFWSSFLRGANSMGWWRVDNFLAPHGGPSWSARALADSARLVFDGLGKLLNVDDRTEMQHDGIALLHSFASAQAATHLPEPGHTYGTYSGWFTNEDSEIDGLEMDWGLKPGGKNHFAWHRAIRALGLQFNYVSDRMLRFGEFRPDKYKVLILSQCEALGAQEAEVVREFVRGGGTVLADVRPGLYDGHCKPLSGGTLDDVFGVRHTGSVAAFNAPGLVDGRLGGRNVAVRLANLFVNPAVELDGATALGRAGGTPICIVHPYGRGQAILLNFTMNSFPNLSALETLENAADFLDALLAFGGVQWPLRLLDENGTRMRNVEAVRWKTGPDLEVVAFYAPADRGRHLRYPARFPVRDWTAAGTPARLRVRLPVARAVTEFGAGRSTRPKKEFRVHIRPREPVFVALSDRKLEPPTLSPRQQTAFQGETVILRAQIPRARGRHALKLRVTAPNGAPAPWFDRSLIVGEQGADIALRLARNEQPGRWTVAATDLYTGRKVRAEFEVHPVQDRLSRRRPDRSRPERGRVRAQSVLGRTPLHRAAAAGNLNEVTSLLAAGADPEAADAGGWTPLHAAVEGDSLAAAKALVEAGATPAGTSRDGWTPLLLAAHLGRHDLVTFLLERGADVAARDERGATALHTAARRRHAAIVNLLLAAGADAEAEDAAGMTARDLAESAGLKWRAVLGRAPGVLPETWLFRPDPANTGEPEQWYLAEPAAEGWKPISTESFWTAQPFPGDWHGTGWYRIDFSVEELGLSPESVRAAGAVRIAFGAIDGHPKVWLNGRLVGERNENLAAVWNKPWSVDVTGYINPQGTNQLAVSCTKDDHAAGIHPGEADSPVRIILE